MNNVLAPNLNIDTLYNGDPVPDADLHIVAAYNRLVGNVRIKQIRIVEGTCSPSSRFEDYVKFCYSDSLQISKTAYGPGGNFTYSSPSNDFPFVSAYDQRDYPKGGFIVDLKLNDSSANVLQKIDKLKTGGWIDKSTRVVVVAFNVYNPNLNLIGVVQAEFEFIVSGSVLPSITVRAARAER